ncbi:MAG TPA: hypothetical protein VK665_19055 [Candidatus Elarobacter sp.]|nr:hypothetical protein [Candidatus Elarobacter sp.]
MRQLGAPADELATEDARGDHCALPFDEFAADAWFRGLRDERARDMLLELDDPTVIRAGGMPGKPGGGPDSPETDAPADEEDEEDEEASPT